MPDSPCVPNAAGERLSAAQLSAVYGACPAGIAGSNQTEWMADEH